MAKGHEGAVKQLEKHSAAWSCSCIKCECSPSLARSAKIDRSLLQNKAGYVQADENIGKMGEGISKAEMRSTTRTLM